MSDKYFYCPTENYKRQLLHPVISEFHLVVTNVLSFVSKVKSAVAVSIWKAFFSIYGVINLGRVFLSNTHVIGFKNYTRIGDRTVM